MSKSQFIEENFKLSCLNDWQIERNLRHYFISNYTLTPHSEYGFTVEVDGDVNLTGWDLVTLPFKFSKVTGDFLIARQYLVSLIGCPEYVGGDFNCQDNSLTSLQYCPIEVGGSFNCAVNKIVSLKGIQKHIKGNFTCRANTITSLYDGPDNVVGQYAADKNNISSLEHFPSSVLGSISLVDNPIEKEYKNLIQAARFAPLYALHLKITRPKKEKAALEQSIAQTKLPGGLLKI